MGGPGRDNLGVCGPIGRGVFRFKVLNPDGTWSPVHTAGSGALYHFDPLPEQEVRRKVVTRWRPGHGRDESFVPSPVLPELCRACGNDRSLCEGRRLVQEREAAQGRILDRVREAFARLVTTPERPRLARHVWPTWNGDKTLIALVEIDGATVSRAIWEAARAEGLPLGDYPGQDEEPKDDEELEEDAPDPASPETVFVLELTVKGDRGAARDAVASALDSEDHSIQDAVNAHEADEGPVKVTSALVVLERYPELPGACAVGCTSVDQPAEDADCTFEDCDQERVPGEGFCAGHKAQEERIADEQAHVHLERAANHTDVWCDAFVGPRTLDPAAFAAATNKCPRCEAWKNDPVAFVQRLLEHWKVAAWDLGRLVTVDELEDAIAAGESNAQIVARLRRAVQTPQICDGCGAVAYDPCSADCTKRRMRAAAERVRLLLARWTIDTDRLAPIGGLATLVSAAEQGATDAEIRGHVEAILSVLHQSEPATVGGA
jgi:hypothetical protein